MSRNMSEVNINHGEPQPRETVGGGGVLLPASIWASIFSEYCAFEDVRSCLAASKYLWHDVPPLMERLFVFKAAGLDPRYASRFANLERAYVYSLISIASNEEEEADDDETGCEIWWHTYGDEPPSTVFCPETARNLVPFLECFPKLEALQLGAYGSPWRTSDGSHCAVPYAIWKCKTEGHEDMFRGMLRDFCDSFERQSLDARTLHLYGILDAMRYPQLRLDRHEGGGRPCDLCQRICQTFPLSIVSCNAHHLEVCQTYRERLAIVFQRDSSFLKNSGILVRELMGCGLVSGHVILPPSRHYLREAFTMIISFDESTFEQIEFLRNSCGCDPAVEDLQPFLKLHPHAQTYMNREPLRFEGNRNYMPRELFERLVRIGFKLLESDFILVVPRPKGGGEDPGFWIHRNYWILGEKEEKRWESDEFDPV